MKIDNLEIENKKIIDVATETEQEFRNMQFFLEQLEIKQTDQFYDHFKNSVLVYQHNEKNIHLYRI